jgi:hypothetical protein
MTTFKFLIDPGHGWIEVNSADLHAVGLKPTDFSRYSYRSTSIIGPYQVFYLEEDCDAVKFIHAWEAVKGEKPAFREVYQECAFIRDLPSIH